MNPWFIAACAAGFVGGFAGSFIWCPLCWLRHRTTSPKR